MKRRFKNVGETVEERYVHETLFSCYKVLIQLRSVACKSDHNVTFKDI